MFYESDMKTIWRGLEIWKIVPINLLELRDQLFEYAMKSISLGFYFHSSSLLSGKRHKIEMLYFQGTWLW